MAPKRQSGPGIFDDHDAPDLDDEPGALLEAERRGTGKKKTGKLWAELDCATCGRRYWVGYLVTVGPPVDSCCGDLYCDAVMHWTAEEWATRAASAHRRPPPPPPFTLLRHASQGQACAWCGAAVGIYTVPLTVLGHDRALACTASGCGAVVRTYTAEPSPSDRLDVEALRRHPTPPPAWTGRAAVIEGDWVPGQWAPPVHEPVGPQYGPARPLCWFDHREDGAMVSRCGRRAPLGPRITPLDAGMTAWEDQATCEACRAPAPVFDWPSGPPGSLLEPEPVKAVPLPADAIVCARPAWTQSPSPPPVWLAALHEPVQLPPVVEPVALAPKPLTPVCQLVGRLDGHLISKCGRKVKTGGAVTSPGDAGMSAFGATCQACLEATRWPEGVAGKPGR